MAWNLIGKVPPQAIGMDADVGTRFMYWHLMAVAGR
jgi:hypothetical protein